MGRKCRGDLEQRAAVARAAAFKRGQQWFEGVWDKHAFVNSLTGGLHWMDYWEDKPPHGFIPGVLAAVDRWEQACCPE